jgi:DNA-binding transcriptional MerR regulator
MAEQTLSSDLPPIPAKRYFTIGEVSELCGVKPHVLRYWEQEFTQLKPVKRRGNRRYYQHHEVLLIRRIRALLYDDGFTISGARNLLDAKGRLKSEKSKSTEDLSLEIQSSEMEGTQAAHTENLSGLREVLKEVVAMLKA